eukprot:jgi/Mesvir1/868/Mv17438-RA.2
MVLLVTLVDLLGALCGLAALKGLHFLLHEPRLDPAAITRDKPTALPPATPTAPPSTSKKSPIVLPGAEALTPAPGARLAGDSPFATSGSNRMNPEQARWSLPGLGTEDSAAFLRHRGGGSPAIEPMGAPWGGLAAPLGPSPAGWAINSNVGDRDRDPWSGPPGARPHRVSDAGADASGWALGTPPPYPYAQMASPSHPFYATSASGGRGMMQGTPAGAPMMDMSPQERFYWQQQQQRTSPIGGGWPTPGNTAPTSADRSYTPASGARGWGDILKDNRPFDYGHPLASPLMPSPGGPYMGPVVSSPLPPQPPGMRYGGQVYGGMSPGMSPASDAYPARAAMLQQQPQQAYGMYGEPGMGMGMSPGGSEPGGWPSYLPSPPSGSMGPMHYMLSPSSQPSPSPKPAARGSLDGVHAALPDTYSEALYAVFGDDYPYVELWTDRLREWISSHVVKTLLAAIERNHADVNRTTAALGADVKIAPLVPPDPPAPPTSWLSGLTEALGLGASGSSSSSASKRADPRSTPPGGAAVALPGGAMAGIGAAGQGTPAPSGKDGGSGGGAAAGGSAGAAGGVDSDTQVARLQAALEQHAQGMSPPMVECMDALHGRQMLQRLLSGGGAAGLLPFASVPLLYTVGRLREWSVGCCMARFRWDSGGDKGTGMNGSGGGGGSGRSPFPLSASRGNQWTPELPNDSQLLLYILCAFFEHPDWQFRWRTPARPLTVSSPFFVGALPPRPPQYYTAMLPSPPPEKHSGALALVTAANNPPAFFIFSNGQALPTLQGHNGLFHSIILFCRLVQRDHGGRVGTVDLRSPSINLLPLLEPSYAPEDESIYG